MSKHRWVQLSSDDLVHVLYHGSDDSPRVLARCGVLLPSWAIAYEALPPGPRCEPCLLVRCSDHRPGIRTWNSYQPGEPERGVLIQLLEELALGVATLARVERECPGQYRAAEAECWRRVARVYAQLLAARSGEVTSDG